MGKVVGHVEVNGAGRIIPVNINATKDGAIPVHGDGVVFFLSGLEMEDVAARGGFDANVNQETEADVTPHLAPQAWCVLAMVVPFSIEMLFK